MQTITERNKLNGAIASVKRTYPRSSLRPSECDDSGRASARPASPPQDTAAAFSSREPAFVRFALALQRIPPAWFWGVAFWALFIWTVFRA